MFLSVICIATCIIIVVFSLSPRQYHHLVIILSCPCGPVGVLHVLSAMEVQCKLGWVSNGSSAV